jgi:HAD superfamily hydrolase (TIGR01509 family)
LRAVLFDFDGVLVNSEPLHYRALRDGLLPEGFAIDEDEYLQYVGYHDREAIRMALERHDCPATLERVDTVARRKAGIYEALLADVPFFPGARELVEALARQMPLAIASGARRREIEEILSAAGLRDRFAAVVGAEDVTHRKPSPEPYLVAFRHLAAGAPGLTPADCLVIEDSMPGIAAGLAAGMRVLGVAHTFAPARLSAAHHVVSSLGGLTPDGLRAAFGSA